MRGYRSSSKSGLFLMELIIAIAFFACSSAVCIQLFAKAHQLSAKSANTNMAVHIAQSAAESFKSTGASAERMSALLESDISGDVFVIHYDENWNRQPEAGRFTMTVRMESADDMAVADITVTDSRADGVALYQLSAQKYLP